MYVESSYYFAAETNVDNNQQELLVMIYLKPVNKLNMTITITQLAPSPQPSTNLWGEQICMSALDTANIQFATTPKGKFQDQ